LSIEENNVSTDIDLKRIQIRVKDAKGKKDRYTILSEKASVKKTMITKKITTHPAPLVCYPFAGTRH
jgi:hypothetical protein